MHFLIQLVVGLVFVFVILYFSIKIDALKRGRRKDDVRDVVNENQTTQRIRIGGYNSSNYQSAGDIVIGEDQAGGYVLINGEQVYSGLKGNITVEVTGNVNNITCAHLKVTGDVNGKVDTTHFNVTGSVSADGNLKATHFTVGRDVKCQDINATHVNIGGKTTARDIKAVHVRSF